MGSIIFRYSAPLPCCTAWLCCLSVCESYSVAPAPASTTLGPNFRPAWTSLLGGRCLLSCSAWWCRPATCSSCPPTKPCFPGARYFEKYKTVMCWAALASGAVTLKTCGKHVRTYKWRTVNKPRLNYVFSSSSSSSSPKQHPARAHVLTRPPPRG